MTDQNSKQDFFNRGTGVLIIEVRNSNPNGDPDRESDPRQRQDEIGEISPVSFKRKIRDLIENKIGPVWQNVKTTFPTIDDNGFYILESRGRDRKQIMDEIAKNQFAGKYWDARIFGNTFLEEGESNSIRSGVVQFGMGLSVAPIEIERHTNTNKSGVQEGLDRGMAPLAYRIVQHGIYVMPFFVNSTAATKSGCTKQDIEVVLKVLPYAYSHNPSYVRPAVEIRHAWYIEHKSALGSCSDFALIDALTPKKINDPQKPSKSISEYGELPNALPENLKVKVNPLRDLMAEAF